MATLSELLEGIELTENKEPLNLHEDVGKWEKAILANIKRGERYDSETASIVMNGKLD